MKLSDESYFAVLKICGVDIFNYQEEDKRTVYQFWAQAETRLGLPHKFIFMDSLPSLAPQREHILHKLENVTHEYRRFILEREINRFNILEDEQKDRVSYLMVFGKSIEELDKAVTSFILEMRDTALVSIEGDELKLMLSNYLKFENERVLQKPPTEELNKLILPEGLEIRSNCLKVGEKYVTSLQAYRFPAYISDLLFAELFSIGNVRVTLDINFKIKDVVKKEIQQSMDELASRHIVDKSSASGVSNAYEYNDLQELFVAIDRSNEQIVSSTIRFWLSSYTEESLQTQVSDLKKILTDNGIDVMIPENDMEYEFKSLTIPSDPIGQSIPLYETLAKQFPFYYQSLIDENGTYCGQTGTGGQVILDTFKIDKAGGRESFDTLLLGVKGSGKSVTLKAMIQNIIALGHKGFVLDVDREYGGLAEVLGGKIIKFGKFSKLNPLQLRVTVVKSIEADGAAEETENNFTLELSRIETFLYQYNPELTTFAAEEFKTLLQLVYADRGIYSETDLTTLSPEDFPIFSDVLDKLRTKLYSHYESDDVNTVNDKLSENKRNAYEVLEVTLKGLAEGVYSSIFNGISNIDINNENFVIFDVRDISEMSDNVYNAQLFSILSLMWGEICNNKIRNQMITDERERSYIVSLIDEAHRFINTKNSQAVEYITKLVRRARKYDAGLWFASQSILDFMPASSTSEETDKMRTIFSLVQYKMLMKQPESSKQTLLSVFPQFTESEIDNTAIFKAGETLLSLGSGKNKIRFERLIPPHDLAVFGGGRERLDNLEVGGVPNE